MFKPILNLSYIGGKRISGLLDHRAQLTFKRFQFR
jgi:hypothetical protein